MTQDGLPADFQKLFGPVGSHPDALSTSDDDCVTFHVKILKKTA
jgi:hypothetical protein